MKYKTKERKMAKISGGLFGLFLFYMSATIFSLFNLYEVNDGISAFWSIISLLVTVLFLYFLITDAEPFIEKHMVRIE